MKKNNLSKRTFIVGYEVLKQKGSHQRNPQEAVDQGKANHQSAQESLSSCARELQWYNEQRQLSKNQTAILEIQQEIANSKARPEVYNKHGARSIDGRSQLSYKLDLAQRCQPSKIAQSSLHHHRSSALQKDNDTTIMIKVG